MRSLAVGFMVLALLAAAGTLGYSVFYSEAYSPPVLYSLARCEFGMEGYCSETNISSEFKVFFTEHNIQYLARILLHSGAVALFATVLAVTCVFTVEVYMRPVRHLFYFLCVLSFFVLSPIKALAYYEAIAWLGCSESWGSDCRSYPRDYLPFFLASVMAAFPVAVFPVQIAFSKNEVSRRSLMELRSIPVLAILIGYIRNAYVAVIVGFCLCFAYALGISHEANQFEQHMYSAYKFTQSFQNSTFGELYVVASLFAFLSVTVVTLVFVTGKSGRRTFL